MTTCPTNTMYSWSPKKRIIFKNSTYKRTKNSFNSSFILTIFILVLNLIKLSSQSGNGQLRPPVITEQPVDVTVRRNEPTTLNCKTEGNPAPTVEWFKDGQKIKPSVSPMILPAGGLFFLKVNQKSNNYDTGVYWCEATNILGKARSRNATLSLAMLKENFQLDPQNLRLPAGQKAVFHCSAPKGQPPPRVYWKKDDEVVRAVFGRVQQLSNGSLIVNDVRKSDEGRFVCVAENMLGIRESNPAMLKVFVKPNFIQPPEDITAKIGERIKFQCVVDGDPRPVVRWRKENSQLLNSRVEIDIQDNSLIIRDIELSDDGFYICEAKNLIGNNTAAASLTVHSAPTFLVVPTDITVSVNGVAKLPCAVSGNPGPNLFWSKEGNQALLFPGNSNGRFTVTQSGHLTITDLQVEDTGFYVCSAVSVVGSAMAKAFIKVTSAFEGPPPIIKFGPANQTLPTDTMALLPCEVMQSSPNIQNAEDSIAIQTPSSKIKIHWLKSGQIINSIFNRRFVQLESGTLQINSLQITDTGTYTCIATYTFNEEGNRSTTALKKNTDSFFPNSFYDQPNTNWSATLTVESPRNPNIAFHRQPDFNTYPSIPSKPVIINFTNNEITVSWRKVQDIGSSPLIGYRLEYYDADSAKPTWIIASNRIFTEIYTVKNLQPNTRYVFQVRAENSHGLSAPSQMSVPVKTFKIAPNRINSFGNQQIATHENDLDHVRSHLNEIKVIFKEAKPFSANSVKLFWEIEPKSALASKDKIEGFYIRFRDVGIDLDEVQKDIKLLNKPSLSKMTNFENQKYNMLIVSSSDSLVNSFVISDLSEFTLYEIFVVPFYKSVNGPPSNSRLVRTFADLPSAPPTDIKAHLLNTSSISVSWKPVPKPQRNGIIQAYNIMLVLQRLANNTNNKSAQQSFLTNNNPSFNHLQMNPSSANQFINLPFDIHRQDQNSLIFPPNQLDSGLDLNGKQINLEHSPLLMNPENFYSQANFHPSIEFNENHDLTDAALISRNNAKIASSNQQNNFPMLFHSHQATNTLFPQLTRNITTNATTHHIIITDLQPGAIYQLRISASSMVGYGPASAPIFLEMSDAYVIEGVNQDESSNNGFIKEGDATKKLTNGSFNRDLFNSKIITIIFTLSLAAMLIGAVCFVINRRGQNQQKYDKASSSSTVSNKKFFPNNSKTNKFTNELFSNSSHPIITNDNNIPNSDALWIDRNWLAATQGSQNLNTNYTLLKNKDSSFLLNDNRIDHRSTSSAIYASTSQLNVSKPNLENTNEYCGLQSQNDYAEVSELTTNYGKNDSNNQNSIAYPLSNICNSNSNNNAIMSSAYATTTLINLNQNVTNNKGRVALAEKPSSLNQDTAFKDYNEYEEGDFHCQNSMLYEKNSSVEPTLSTLLLQRTPSENESYTTDEYSYKKNNTNKHIKKHENNKLKKANYNNGTLCSKSSTASSHISEISKTSNIESTNKPSIFTFSELPSIPINTEQTQDSDSPPPPAPNPIGNTNQRFFTTLSNQNNINKFNNSNIYESAYDTSLYGGTNRVQLGSRQHFTLNSRQLMNQNSKKNNSKNPKSRILDFIELKNDFNNSNRNQNKIDQNNTMNLISNPLNIHQNNSLQGSLPSLPNDSNTIDNCQNFQKNKLKNLISNNIKLNNDLMNYRNQQNLNALKNSSFHRSNSSLASESDNFYCDIDEAQRVQAEFRAKLHNDKLKNNELAQNYLDNQDINFDNLPNEQDKLIDNHNFKKEFLNHQNFNEDKSLLSDQYSEYECIENVSDSISGHYNKFKKTANYNEYLDQQKNHFKTYNQSSISNNQRCQGSSTLTKEQEKKLIQNQFNSIRNNKLNSQNYSNQSGLFRYK